MNDEILDALRASLSRRELLRRTAAVGVGAAALPFLTSGTRVLGQSASPAGGSGNALKFVAWQFDPDDLKKILDDWSQLHGVPISLEVLPGGDSYTPTITSRIQGGDQIDVMYQFPYDAGKFVAQGWGRDLRDMSGVNDMLADMYPSARGYYQTADGSVIGAPYFNAVHSFFYNKTHMAKLGVQPPTTLQDVYDQSKAIKAAGINQTPYVAFWSKSFMEEYLNVYLIAEGVKMWGDDGSPVFADDPKSLGVLEWWQSMYQDGLTTPTMLTDDPTKLATLMGTGGASFFVLHHYFLPIIRTLKDAPEAPNVDILYERMPGASGQTFQMAGLVQMGTMGTGQAVDDAWNLMKFFGWKDETGNMTTFKAWANYAQLGAPYPAFWKDPEVIAGFTEHGFDVPKLTAQFETGSEIEPARTASWYQQFASTVGDRLQGMLLGQATPADTLKGLADDARTAQSGGI